MKMFFLIQNNKPLQVRGSVPSFVVSQKNNAIIALTIFAYMAYIVESSYTSWLLASFNLGKGK